MVYLAHFILSNFAPLTLRKTSDIPEPLSEITLQHEDNVMTKSEIVNILEGMYILLILDQLPNGLWGRSVADKYNPTYTKETMKGSPSVSWYIAKALLKYANDPLHPAIQNFLKYLEEHRDPQSAAVGLKVRYTTSPDVAYPFKIFPNCRHTAISIKLLIQINREIRKSVSDGITFLIEHQKANGWGLAPEDAPDCLSTSSVLEALILADKFGIKKHLEEKIARKLSTSITKGMTWLADNLHDSCWIYGDNTVLRFRYTTIVLKEVPQFKKYYPGLYQLALRNLVENFQLYNGGFPLVTGGELDIFATAWFLLILDGYYKEYKSMIELGLHTLTTSVKTPKHFLQAYAPDWATVLGLCVSSFASAELDQSRRAYLDDVIEKLRRNEEQIGLDNIRIRNFLPNEFHWLEDAILTHVFLPEDERDGKVIRGRMLYQQVEERRRDLLVAIEKCYSDERKSLMEKRKDLDKFIAKVRREKGERAARDLEDVYKEQVQEESIQKRYEFLKTRILRTVTAKDFEQIEKEVHGEWAL